MLLIDLFHALLLTSIKLKVKSWIPTASRLHDSFVDILVSGSGTSSLFSIPSNPASKIAANAMYGLAAGSTERTSIRADRP